MKRFICKYQSIIFALTLSITAPASSIATKTIAIPLSTFNISTHPSFSIDETIPPRPQSSFLALIIKPLAKIAKPALHALEHIIVGLFDFLRYIIESLFDGVAWAAKKVVDISERMFDINAKTINPPSSDLGKTLEITPQAIDPADAQREYKYEMSIQSDPSFGIFASIPTSTQDYKLIFGNTEPTQGALVETNEVSTQLRLLHTHHNNTIESSKFGRSGNDFLQYISTVRSKYIVIVGHNENGNFAFMEPPPLTISRMATFCTESSKICIFLSCESHKYIDPNNDAITIKKTISYRIASKIIDELIRATSNSSSISPAQINNAIQSAICNEKLKPAVKFIFISSAAGTSLAGITILLEKEYSPATKQASTEDHANPKNINPRAVNISQN